MTEYLKIVKKDKDGSLKKIEEERLLKEKEEKEKEKEKKSKEGEIKSGRKEEIKYEPSEKDIQKAANRSM